MPKHVIRQIIPIKEPMALGGTDLDEALLLWFQWRGSETGLPDWTAFQPFKHPHMLPLLSVAKREGDEYRCVLVGEALRDRLPIKLEGRIVSEVMPSINADDLRMRFDRALGDQLPNYAEKTLAWIHDHALVSYHALVLPFKCKADGQSRILTMTDFDIPIT